MRRRGFIAFLGGMAVWSPGVWAQAPPKVARIGVLTTGSLESPETLGSIDAFRQGLRERGYVEGETIVVEYRGADGALERLPDLAEELVRLKVDLIVAPGTPAARAAQKATATIPIIASAVADPVGDGLVTSLARPGGNVTGLAILAPELAPKALVLIKEALPKASRVAGLWHPAAFHEPTARDMLMRVKAAARTLQMELRLFAVRSPDELDRAFLAMSSERADALLTLPSPMFFAERRRLADLAASHGLPSMALAREYADVGGLMAYGASPHDLFRHSATYVDRILKGAKPAELPVEQPTRFELVVNLKTAKALGLSIPASLLARADEVIE